MPFIGKQSTSNSQITNYTTTVGSGGQTNFTVVIEGGDETHVYLNGVLLKETTDYTVSSTQVSLVSPAVENDIVEIKVFRSFALVDAVKATGGTFSGDVTLPNLTLSSNVIKASDGGSTITLDTSDNVTIAGAISANNLVGMIASFAMATPPTGWLACDGSAVSKATYSALFTALGANAWGTDTTDNFYLPDLEGAFLRGTGSNATHNMANGNDFAGPSVGSFENDSMQNHAHQLAFQSATGNANLDTGAVGLGRQAEGGLNYAYGSSNATNDNIIKGLIEFNSEGTPRAGDETRPFNAGVKYCIKY